MGLVATLVGQSLKRLIINLIKAFTPGKKVFSVEEEQQGNLSGKGNLEGLGGSTL